MWQREYVCIFEIDICGLHVIRFLDCPAYPSSTSSPSSQSFPSCSSRCLSKYLQRQQTVATATAAVCAAKRINSQDEFSFRYFRLTSVSPCVCVCVCWCMHCSCFFDIFNCLFAQHMDARCCHSEHMCPLRLTSLTSSPALPPHSFLPLVYISISVRICSCANHFRAVTDQA